MPLFTIYLCCLLLSGCLSIRNNTSARKERQFSLFSIVQFPNQACSSTSGTYSNGTCFTSSECSSRGGSSQGNCAAGFGVCCVFSVSATGSTVSENCSYIVNPNYPSNYATAGTITYTIKKASTDVCRIRLDYDTLVLTQPTGTGVATAGQCAVDRLTFMTTDRTTTPTVAATGTYGDYPYICGTNTGYHSYLDLSCMATDDATLTFTLGDTTDNQWKVKVTQLSCSDPCIASQQGCFQYHTGTTGTIQSYNLAGGQQLAGQNYKNCIRQEAGHCCIEYIPTSYDINPTTCADTISLRCASVSMCTLDYILIPEVQHESGVDQPGSYDRFCGALINPTGVTTTNQPVTTCKSPFEVTHTTAPTALNGGAATTGAGFSFNFRQIPGNC